MFPYSTCISSFFWQQHPYLFVNFKMFFGLVRIRIIESVDSISRDERGFPLTQYITNGRISRSRYIHYHAF